MPNGRLIVQLSLGMGGYTKDHSDYKTPNFSSVRLKGIVILLVHSTGEGGWVERN